MRATMIKLWPRKASRGSTLVEVAIAMLLLALAASTMAGTMLQTSAQSGRLQRKEQAALRSNELMEALKNYVTDDHSDLTRDMAPGRCWTIVDPRTGACPAGWAFDSGLHDVTFLLSGSLLGAPLYKASLIYNVTTLQGLPDVKIALNWTEP